MVIETMHFNLINSCLFMSTEESNRQTTEGVQVVAHDESKES